MRLFRLALSFVGAFALAVILSGCDDSGWPDYIVQAVGS